MFNQFNEQITDGVLKLTDTNHEHDSFQRSLQRIKNKVNFYRETKAAYFFLTIAGNLEWSSRAESIESRAKVEHLNKLNKAFIQMKQSGDSQKEGGTAMQGTWNNKPKNKKIKTDDLGVSMSRMSLILICG